MNDNDIIKYFNSLYIKLLDVKYDLKITHKEFSALNNVYYLITRQQAEIENLKFENQSLRGAANSLKMHYEEAQAEIERLEVENSHYAELEQGCYVTGVKNIKAVAYKEFAERLKEKFGIADCIVTINNDEIDNLVKETVGE